MSKERAQQCSMLVGILHSTDRSKSSTTLMSRFGTLVSTELNANKGYVLWSQERFTGALHSFYDGAASCHGFPMGSVIGACKTSTQALDWCS
jgi:hypothetical protein